jgi:hypothetical protein
MMGVMVVEVIIGVILIAALWKVFAKAGKPGWAAIVPIYNIIVMLQIAGKPAWWIILFFIPIANVVVGILIAIGIANAFGKSGAFAAGLILLGFIFYPILGFGSSQYQGAPR